MRTDISSSGDMENTGKALRPASLGALRLAATRLSETRKKPRLKTRDLVGLLLSHGARAWRSSQYPVQVRLSVCTPEGARAVTYSYRLPA